ncbi:MAG: Crp/Fnr family transcriptional regulator [Aestuariivirga sp.]|nr:Crp/Fnr family transcriptional regulator [Aestuariivirga sp.]
MSVRADVETIRSIPIFSECEPAHLQLLAFSAVRKGFEPGEMLVSQGTPGTAAYLILSGRVDISTKEAGSLGEAGPGALLGEVAMIGGSPYSITARATEDVATARIDRDLFLRVAQEFPEFGTAVLRSLTRKLEQSVEDLGQARTLFEKARSFRSL